MLHQQSSRLIQSAVQEHLNLCNKYVAKVSSYPLQGKRAMRLGSIDNIMVVIVQLQELHPYEDP